MGGENSTQSTTPRRPSPNRVSERAAQVDQAQEKQESKDVSTPSGVGATVREKESTESEKTGTAEMEETGTAASPAKESPPESFAGMSSLENQLMQMLECKICFENKERQRLLPCQHTICLDCLNKLKVEGGRYKCPLCNVEHYVPNGGFEALQESLITKQLAALIQLKVPAAGGDNQPVVRMKQTATPPARSMSVEKRLEIEGELTQLKQKAEHTLEQATTKNAELTSELEEVENTTQKMKDALNKLVEETINKLMLSTTVKVSAIDALAANRKAEIEKTISKLTDISDKARKGLEVARSERAASMDDQVLAQAKEAVSYVDDTLASFETHDRRLRAGDSVRLKLNIDSLNTEFLLNDLNHNSVGYIIEVDGDGDSAVLFPENSRWTGNVRVLEYSQTKHNLPMVGDYVRVKESVAEPHFKWGMIKRGSIGILSELKNRGPSSGRQVEVDFDEDHDWTGLFDELEKVEPEPLKVGEKVWIAKDVSEPARGWAGVTQSSVGTLVSVNGKEVEVMFPECEYWKGMLHEIERVRRITIGDQVRVKRSVVEPRFAWGGVDHNDVGKVAKIMNSSEHGQVVKIDFPNRVVHWQCLMDEIEVVRRVTGLEPTRTRRGSRPESGCPTQ